MDIADSFPDEDDIESAIALHEAGRLPEAERLCLKILERDPDEPDALNLLGVILQERGELARSIELISRALQRDPDFPEALANLARAQRATGELSAAVENATRAEELDPELAEAPLILSRTLLDLGNAAEAAEAGYRAATLAPESYEAHACLGMALERSEDWPGAVTAFQAALDLQPSRVTMQVELAGALLMAGEHDQAIPHFRAAAERVPNELPPHVGLAMALENIGDIPGSASACRRALELAPERADLWALQGLNMQALGRFDEATECHSRALALAPGSADELRNLALIGRLARGAPEVSRLEAIIADEAAAAKDRILAGAALGMLLDKAGSYDEAFARFKAANELTRAHLGSQGKTFELAEVQGFVSAAIASINRDVVVRTAGKRDPSELPVFVVGMPRSGTSLVEQIAASHPRVHGAGENKDIYDIVERLKAQYPDVHPANWDPTEVRRETDAYLDRLRKLGGDVDRVIEKLPDNILYIGYIALLFPHARIIVCRRDLRDVCLSCYFQHFVDPNTWSLDLADCAARAREVERLLTHWRQVIPLPMLEVQYETLVGDLEGQSRRLIEFLGLEWDPACLAFHETERVVRTLSQWQVRQPLYRTSIGRWHHYRAHIRPLLDGLEGLVPPDSEDDPATASVDPTEGA